jgi:hypothetical protein
MAMKPRRPARFDYEYERHGTANLFRLFAPLEGWRHVKFTERHTAVDCAHLLKDLADLHFSHAETIALVQDNLNTHTKAALHQACARRGLRGSSERFDWHDTPKRGKLAQSGRIRARPPRLPVPRPPHPRQADASDQVAAWEHHRNTNNPKADWHFTTQDARVRLKHLYPSI